MVHGPSHPTRDEAGSFNKSTGEVEADETFIGGLARYMHKDQKAKITGTGGVGKAIVMGLLERHARQEVASRPGCPKRPAGYAQAQVRENVRALLSDHRRMCGYQALNRDYTHKVIDHAEAYVKGNIHTNGIENFWSLLKRGLKGTYVSVEPFHLFRYVDEQAYRFNNRKTTDGERFITRLGLFLAVA